MTSRIEAVIKKDHDYIVIIWEASVRATHHFLREEDIVSYRSLFPGCLDSVGLYCIREDERIAGFIGVADRKIEMLFIHPDMRGRGLGKLLTDYAIYHLEARKVDVNEQNEQALGFYLHYGFTIVGRSEHDGMNKPYPLLHLKLPPQYPSSR